MKIDLENVMRKSTSLIFKIHFLRYKNVQPPPFLGKCDSCDNPIVTHRHFVSKSFDSVYFSFNILWNKRLDYHLHFLIFIGHYSGLLYK